MLRLAYFFALFSSFLTAMPRGTSAPYISGDTFRSYCDFVYDELDKSFSPLEIKEGNTIFVKTDYLDEFFSNMHPKITCRYVLVSHNSDHPIPGPFASFLDDNKLIAWFGQNVENFLHPKIFPIPIGVANKCWPHGNVRLINNLRKSFKDIQKKYLLYMNFQIGTYANERSKVFEIFKDKPYCYASKPEKYSRYLKKLALSKFVLSPRGNGLDCHRTWEALYMGAIPIVKTSSLDSMYENLPVLIINDWNEINDSFLMVKYAEMQSKSYNMEKLFIDHWIKKINFYKK